MQNQDYNYSVIDLNLVSGLSDYEVEIEGAKVQYLSGTATLSVRLQARSNDKIPLEVNDTLNAPFSKLYISASATAETVKLLVAKPGAIEVEGAEVTVNGSMEVTNMPDRHKDADAGDEFIGTLRSTGGTGMQHIQIFNPSSSTVTVRLKRLMIEWHQYSSGIPYSEYIELYGYLSATSLTNDRSTTNIRNKLNPVVDDQGQAELRDQTNAGYVGTAGSHYIFNPFIVAQNTQLEVIKEGNLYIPKGWGLTVLTNYSSSFPFTGLFEWSEI